MFDFDKLGKKALIAPFVLVIALRCVPCLAVAPLLRADPHDISLAIVNLDDGTTTPVGAVNAGEVLASQLTGEESQAAQESTETLAKLTAMKAAAASGAAAATNGAAATESSEAPNLVAVTSSDSAASTNGAVEAAEGAADSGLAAAAAAAASGAAAVPDTASAQAASGAETDDADATSAATSASSSMADALTWATLDSEADLDQRLEDNSLFDGIVIPADFTARQLAAASNPADKPQLTVYLNMGKNPQVANSLQTTMAQSLASAGIDADIQMVNTADVGGGMMAGLIAAQMMVMPLLVMTLSSSIVLSLLTWRRDAWDLRARSPWLTAGTQAAFIVALSALIAAFALLIDVAAGGLDLPAGQLFCWLWLGCACVMLAFVGLTDACLPVGALFAITVFAVGMGTAMLPAELMPTFWADWVFPWAPQAHLGQGVRTIVYCGQNPGMADAGPLMVFAVIGIAALLLAAGLATAKSAKAKDTAPAAA